MDNFVPEIKWRTKYAAAYMENGSMVIRYRFPFSRQREAELLGAHGLAPEERLPYYEKLSLMVERSFAFAEYLEKEAVPSVLKITSSYQKKEDNDVICMYCTLPAPVTPLSQAIFSADYNALTALDVFLRLAHILRDINKTPTSPVLRYMDMDDVYLTEENKILLGGFYYYSAEGKNAPPAFLPDAAMCLPESIRSGGLGSTGTDMQTLCMIAWNVFSGLPWDCQHTPASLKIPPKYAPEPLLRTLELGLQGDSTACTAFRKQLMACRKELSKTDFAQLMIPAPTPHAKEFFFRADRKRSAPQPSGVEELPT